MASSFKQQSASSGSDGVTADAVYDEKKRKRMISNRESARRSRIRKQKHLNELIGQVSKLQNDNRLAEENINVTTQMYVGVESENNVLRAQLSELTDRLLSLNTILRIAEDVSGLSVDVPELSDTLLEPWQLLGPTLPIRASADMFEF